MVLRNRDFALHWCGQVVSQMGNQFNAVALAWLMLVRTGSATGMGGVFLAQLLPNALFGWVVGVVVDRYDRRRLMIACDWIRCAAVLAIPILWTAGRLPDWGVYLATFAVSTLSVVFFAAERAVIGQLVTVEELTDANAFAEVSGQLAGLIGPVLAGLAISVLPSPVQVLYIDAASFGVSALCIAAMRWRDAARTAPATVRHVLDDVTEGFRYLRGSRFLLSVILTFAAANFFISPIFVLFPLLAKKVLDVGALGYGWLVSAFGAGMLAGSLAAGWLSRRFSTRLLLYGGMALLGATQGAIYFFGQYLAVDVVLVAVGGFAVAPANALVLTLIQRTTPQSLQGRVFAMVGAIAGGISPIGVACGAPLEELFGVREIFLGIGIATVITALIGALTMPDEPSVPTAVPRSAGGGR